jgi:hypothetical protein
MVDPGRFPHLRKVYTRFVAGVKWQILVVCLAAALAAALAAGGCPDTAEGAWLTLRESLLAIVIVAAVIAPG